MTATSAGSRTSKEVAVPTPNDEQEPMALNGLRRMVLHARNTLAATAVAPPAAAEFGYNEHWRPAMIRRHAAMLLAEQVLTLVADCLPGGEQMTPDEAAQYRQRHDKAVEQAEQRAKKAQEAAKVAEQRMVQAEIERDSAIEYQSEAEAVEVEQSELLERLRALAQTDVPATIRLLLNQPEPSETADDAAIKSDDSAVLTT